MKKKPLVAMKHQEHAKCVCRYKQDGSQHLAQETNRDATVAVWQQSTQSRDVDDIVRPVQRKLQSQHPSVRKRFNCILERQLKQQGGNKYSNLLDAANIKSRKIIQEEWQGFD